jgi:hypothetical protein
MPCDSDGISPGSHLRQFDGKERRMKKILFTAAVLGLAACGGEKKAEAPAADAPAAAAPAAPAATDSAAATAPAATDSAKASHDSTMARDTTHKQ